MPRLFFQVFSAFSVGGGAGGVAGGTPTATCGSPLRDKAAEFSEKIIEQLTSPEGALTKMSDPNVPPAWSFDREWYQLSIGAVFSDLVAGVAGVQKVLQQYQAKANIELQEARPNEEDPLAFLRRARRSAEE